VNILLVDQNKAHQDLVGKMRFFFFEGEGGEAVGRVELGSQFLYGAKFLIDIDIKKIPMGF
jgi:hypothetical protein